MFAAFLAASLVQWAKVFVEGADDALNKGYKHHAVMGSEKPWAAKRGIAARCAAHNLRSSE